MKKYLLIISLIGFLFGQDKYRFFLESDENLKLLGENYQLVKSELDKMLIDYNSKIDFDNYWKEKYSEQVYTGTSFNEDGYLTALLSLNNPSQADADYLKRSFTKRTYKNVEKERNRIIERVETLSTKDAEWSDIVSYYGGYSELSKLGISKDDKSKFDISVVLEKIELTGPSTCLAHVKINGNDDALKFHKIPKSTYKYKGTCNIVFDKVNYLTLLNGANPSYINVKFEEKQYLPADEIKIGLSTIGLNEIMPLNNNYFRTINLMFDDLVPNSVWTKVDPNFSVLKREYIELCGETKFEEDLDSLTKEQLQYNIYFYGDYKRVFGNNVYSRDFLNISFKQMKIKFEDAKIEKPWLFD